MSRRLFFQSPLLRATAAVALLACSDSGQGIMATPDAPPTVDNPDAAAGGQAVLKRASRSSTIAISDDDKTVVMVNPQNDSISIFQTSDLSRTIVPTGKEPRAVVIGPDRTTAYVANTGDGTVVKVVNIDSNPTVAGTAQVGSEPTGLALSPTGARLFVAAFAEGEIDVIDTASMTEAHAPVKGQIKNPYGVAVTNNGNADDNDELLLVPEFYGEVIPELAADARQLDKSRRGRVRVYDLANLAPSGDSIAFEAHDTGVAPGGAAATVFASPNQLRSIFIRRDATHPEDNGKARLYLTSVAAAPQPPTRFDGDTFPFVYVADLATRGEITTADGTTNLTAKLLNDFEPKGKFDGKFFLGELYDMSFTSSGNGEGSVAYAVAQGADVVQRISFAADNVVLGSKVNNQIDVIGDAKDIHAGCKGPNGIVVANDNGKAYVNCWTSQRMAVIALGDDQKALSFEQAFPPAAENASIDRGRRFYFTGRGRWAGDGTATTPPTATGNGLAWKSCGGCHPNGLSDNITWIFGTGPRQSTSMDGTFSHGAELKQRALNWTAVNDEIHDFERNTRTTAGGLGAITTAAAGDCGTLGKETRQALGGELATPVVSFQDTEGNCQHDWDDIEAWVKTIRPPAALKHVDSSKVARGEAIFNGDGACNKCHGGPGWTISRRPYDVRKAGLDMAAIAAIDFVRGAPWPDLWNNHVKQIELEQPGNVPLVQIACVLRNLLAPSIPNTFGPAALELKPNLTDVAEGNSGYNVPSLYGLSLGAPYLHSGLAVSLDDLLVNFPGHTTAGNGNFEPSADDREALIAYLLSIDAGKPEALVPSGFDKCVELNP